MNQSSQDRDQAHQAREALEDAQSRSRAAAGRLPDNAHWFEAVWLAYIGGLVLSMALPSLLSLLAIAGLLFGLGKAVRVYQERYGVWVSGFRHGRTRIIATVLSVVLVAIMLTVLYYKRHYGLIWPVLPGAAVAMGSGFVLGRLWMRAYRRETSQS